MSIIPSNEFTGKILPSSIEYPYGKAKNVSSQGAGDGTPLVANLLNDIFGFQQFLLDKAGIVPNGTPDTAVNSQYFQALWKIMNMMSITINLTADADYTLTATDNLYKNITITDTGNILTSTRTIFVDNIAKKFIITNNTNFDLTIKIPASTGTTIVPAQEQAELLNNSTDIFLAPAFDLAKNYFGASLTLTDVTASRSAGVYGGAGITYTNNTGNLKWVLIRISGGGYPSGYFYVDNELVSVMSTATSTSNTIIAPVPAGSEYRFDKLAATNLIKWHELI
ncbi:hypothetical protein [Francisella philomiragia]|uniref:hypothetical protein n=1 Tax=Francisella philomiragia TaxID=28110 RepID=UPI00224341F6|nr:hypothetical protein [Francisella philomiragia]